ncbi:HAD family phosphatase [Paucibacter sp. APW11]|uniref:HAD family phosphatase n=1 Tax=Roseateles aquae TaxID=3077235 RepID=A0ABU3PF14_9BURK|nr:HAD family phosphatase [Paucibacter sp. APW11]MDT9001174.1 HAD family phosphatase [Paucibacter sp. APW11]
MFGARRFQAVVFDMDGLLLDSERPIRDAWLRLSAAAGKPLSASDYLQTVGRSRPDCLALLSERFGSVAAAEQMYEAVDAAVAAEIGERGFALKPGALDLLLALKSRRIPCAVASSTRQAGVRERLGRAGLLDFFGPIHGGDQVARGKPHPDLFELAARSLGLAPAQCLVFEDSSYGAQGALTAGMGVALVPDLKNPDPNIAPHCAVLNSLADSLPHLDHWFAA